MRCFGFGGIMSIRETIKDSLGKEYKLSKDYVDVGCEGKERKQILCSKCGNSGFIRIITDLDTPPQSKRCDCRKKQDLAENMERGWKGLVFANKVPSTELSSLVRKNVWVTSSIDNFKGHFRRVAIEKGPTWNFRVLTDADLVQAWLANIAIKGVEILDSDFRDMNPLENDYLTLDHASKANKFLCIILGVKSASNKETSNILVEVLRTRYQLNMPTWIVDQPEKPLAYGHLCYSTEVDFFLKQWPHRRLKLNGNGATSTPEDPTQVREKTYDELPFQTVSRTKPSVEHLVKPDSSVESYNTSTDTKDISSRLANRTRPVKKQKR